MAPKSKEYLEEAYQRMKAKTSHVSFPQLKYPSLRDEGLREPVQWLMGKAMDDGAEGLWRVYDKIYDLTDFIKHHPGGEEWLDLTKGQDITEAFEAHHLTSRPEKIMEKYFVKNTSTPRNSPFTFKEDGFYKTLKREVQEILKTIPKTESKRADFIIDSLFITCLVSSAACCYFENLWMVNFLYMVASLSMGWTVIAAHNYIHRKSNWRMYLFNIGLWSYRDFRVSHALSHHLYPNTLMDLEISAFEPLVFWNPRNDVPAIANFAILTEWVMFPFFFIMNFLKRLTAIYRIKGFYERHYHWQDNLGLLLPIWMFIITGCSLYHAVYMWLWIVCGASFVFFSIGSNAAHHHPDIFKDGDQVQEETIDWGLHEVTTLMDRTDITGNLFKVMTFFGDHVLHHLFPTIDHAELPYLREAFLRNVEKFKANFRATSSFDLLVGQIRMTLKKEPTLLKEE